MYLLILLAVVLYVLVYRKDPVPKVPRYRSWTKIGPLQLFRNPLNFVRSARQELGVPIFQSCMLGRTTTFVTGREAVNRLTSAGDDVMNFADAYSTFIRMAFGDGVLTRKSAPAQFAIMKNYLHIQYVNSYLQPSYDLATKLLSQKLPSRGVVDLQNILLQVSFAVGSRNFLGDDFLSALENYDYQSIFNGFEMGMQFVTEFVPFASKIKSVFDRFKAPSKFDLAVRRLSSDPKQREKDNMFGAILQDYFGDKASVSTFQHLSNLTKIICFGSGFNGYNMMSTMFRSILGNPALLQELREEQETLRRKYGERMTNERLNNATRLHETLMKEMYRNTFPFLLRKAECDMVIGDVTIPKGDLVAYSPQLEHDGLEYTKDGFNLIFGAGTHGCPATKYALAAMKITSGIILRDIDLRVLHTEPMINNRLVTFPTQPAITVEYIRV